MDTKLLQDYLTNQRNKGRRLANGLSDLSFLVMFKYTSHSHIIFDVHTNIFVINNVHFWIRFLSLRENLTRKGTLKSICALKTNNLEVQVIAVATLIRLACQYLLSMLVQLGMKLALGISRQRSKFG